ncbi:MAG TPA: hypothetical protein VGT61_14135 [Thermomicrobiales bacterium]|jgi:hypothetical protein|nr:hypothetical protein [Thermomicrobiales bacterium]
MPDLQPEQIPLERHLATVNDLTVIFGTAQLLERRKRLSRPQSDEDLVRDLQTIQRATLRISDRG